jgi:Dolichyl-phosphate-mannose-protein mannosyltransferase
VARERAALSLLAATAVALALLIPRLGAWGHAMDEGAVLTYADLVTEGAVPHRDFLTFYGPGNPWLVAGAFEVFGASVEIERVVGLVYRLLIVLALFALARRVAGDVSAIFAGVIAATIMAEELVWAYATHGAIAFALVGLAVAAWGVASAPGRRRDLILLCAGVAAGASLLMRIDFAPAVALSIVPLLLDVTWRSRLWYLGGLLGAAGLYVPHLLVVGPAKVERVVSDLLSSAPGRTLPRPGVWDFKGQLLIAAVVFTAVVLVAGAVLWRRERANLGGPLLVAAGLYAAGLLPWMLSRPDELHVGPVAMIPLSLLPAAGFALLRSFGVGRSVLGVLTIAVTAALAVTVHAKADLHSPALPTVENAGRSFSAFPDRTASVGAVVRRLERESRAGETLFVGPQDLRRTNYGPTYIYFLLPKLEPASYYLEMNPQTANREGSGLADELRRADWLVLASEWDGWNEENDSQLLGSAEPNRVVRDDFCLRLESGYYRLYERCD